MTQVDDQLQPALPKHMYVGAEHWAVEREHVLFGSWFCVGRLDELGLDVAERVAVVDVVGESVLVTRDGEGQLHGAYNVCRHRGSQLIPHDPAQPLPSASTARSLRCPYHSWTYTLGGALLKAPHTQTLRGFDPGQFALHPVAAQSWRGFCFVHLTPERATPLADDLAAIGARLQRYPLENLVSGRRLVYEVVANYKVLAENYNECYHCGPVHPELSRLVPAFAGGGQSLEWEGGIPHREGAWTFTTTGTSSRRPFADLDEHERTRHKGELVHPNLFLSCSADHVAAYTLWPLAVDRTKVVCDLLFDAGEAARDDFDPDDAADLWDLVNRQDWAVCESVQRGMGSRAYDQGWFAPMEDASADIRRWLLPRLVPQESDTDG